MSSAASAARKMIEIPWTPRPDYRFTVEQYHRMIEQGILGENDRVELLEGRIIPKMTHNPPHDCSVLLGQTELLSRLSSDWIVRVQSAITIRDSEPEPDLVVARGPARRFARAHPKRDDIALLIEVAETTLQDDRGEKGRLYACNRIVAYWIINLIESQVEVYTDPKAGRSPAYRQRRNYSLAESVPLLIAGQEFGSIPVRDLLP